MTTEFIALNENLTVYEAPSRPFVRLRQRRKLSGPAPWSMLTLLKGRSISQPIFSHLNQTQTRGKIANLTSFR